jgi:hypothetical protein
MWWSNGARSGLGWMRRHYPSKICDYFLGAHCCVWPIVLGHCLWEEFDNGEHSDVVVFSYSIRSSPSSPCNTVVQGWLHRVLLWSAGLPVLAYLIRFSGNNTVFPPTVASLYSERTLVNVSSLLTSSNERPIHTYHAVPLPQPCHYPAIHRQCCVLRESFLSCAWSSPAISLQELSFTKLLS